jgi:hypothetical protein
MLAGVALADTVGKAFTTTATFAVFVHPFASVPVTVYVVVDVGVTVMELVFCPVLQLYVEAPDAVSVELCPAHIVAGDAVAVIVGVPSQLPLLCSSNHSHPYPLPYTWS